MSDRHRFCGFPAVALTLGFALATAYPAFSAYPVRVNAELCSAYRCDLVGPEMWTAPKNGHSAAYRGDLESYWDNEVPFRMLGLPKIGLSHRLYIMHEVPGLVDAFVPSIAERAGEKTAQLAFASVRNRWTPAHMTTYYRARPTGLLADEGNRIGATVLKERKAILADNTFVGELTLKNTLSESRTYDIRFQTAAGIPAVGEEAQSWSFTTAVKRVLCPRKVFAASGTTLSAPAAGLRIGPHGETTFRYALALSPVSAADAARRLAKALNAEDPFAENERAFDDWFEKNVPRLETENPDIRRMYLYRWFLAKRCVHEPRRMDPQHVYSRPAAYESSVQDFACVIGLPVPLQLRELAWERDPSAVRGHALNWRDAVLSSEPNIDLRRYTDYIQFTGESVARILEHFPSSAFARAMLPAALKFAETTAGTDPNRLPIQKGSWPVGAEYQPNFYQFTEPKWDYRHDTQFGPKAGFSIARLVRLDTATYAIGNVLGAARLAEVAGEKAKAEELRAFAASQLDIIRTRHWNPKLGLFLAADPETYRLADEAACYDSFAPYLWGLIKEPKYLVAFDKLIDRSWFWDDFPVTTCQKSCPMYYGAGFVVTPPVANPSKPLPKGCVWNGPMWHYSNTLVAEAFGQAALVRRDLRKKWVEFFDSWSESHWMYGDRTVARAAEDFRPEDGARCGSAWDYFHSSWIDPFVRYRCGVSLSEDGRRLRCEPFSEDCFRLENVPLAGGEYTFEQTRLNGGRLIRIFDASGRVLASGENVAEASILPREVFFAAEGVNK